MHRLISILLIVISLTCSLGSIMVDNPSGKKVLIGVALATWIGMIFIGFLYTLRIPQSDDKKSKKIIYGLLTIIFASAITIYLIYNLFIMLSLATVMAISIAGIVYVVNSAIRK